VTSRRDLRMHIGASENGDCGDRIHGIVEPMAERLALVFEIMFLFIPAHFLKLIISLTAEPRSFLCMDSLLSE